MACGINGLPLLSALHSLSFPASFPYDFMHLSAENVLPNLILFWTGEYKNLDHEDADYLLAEPVWQAIGNASAAAGDTIPSTFGSRVPNTATQKGQFTAETQTFWALYMAPILLRGRFKQDIIYNHFMELVRLFKLCLEYELSGEQVDEIEKGFASWVQRYER